VDIFYWLTQTASRDVDQIISDLRSQKHLAQHKDTKAAEDLPGLGQWYCIECAKWFEGENSLVTHRKGKNHKRR
jgi:bud site selection protein 20